MARSTETARQKQPAPRLADPSGRGWLGCVSLGLKILMLLPQWADLPRMGAASDHAWRYAEVRPETVGHVRVIVEPRLYRHRRQVIAAGDDLLQSVSEPELGAPSSEAFACHGLEHSTQVVR